MYDAAQICLNGHLITEFAEHYPKNKKDFCDDCDTSTITKYSKCNNKINGHQDMGMVSDITDFKIPKYCSSCGDPYPWTQSRITALDELIEKIRIPDSTNQDIDMNDLVTETTKTELMSHYFKGIIDRASPELQTTIKQIGMKLLCDAAKNIIWS